MDTVGYHIHRLQLLEECINMKFKINVINISNELIRIAVVME